MSEGKRTFYSIVVLQVFILTFAVLIGHSLGKSQAKHNIQDSDKLAMIEEAMDYITERYKEGNVDEEELIQGAIEGMTESLQKTYDDPYSQFMPPQMYEEIMDDTAGRFGGLGIEISITFINNYRRLTVLSTLDDSTPAHKAGVEAGDTIMKIDGESTAGISLEEAKEKLRGEPGTKVEITVMREGEDELIDIPIIRGLIQLPTVKSRILDSNIGYIRINQFSDTTPEDMDKSLDELEKAKVKGIVLDLRSNPGGTLPAAVDIASDFLNEGQLVVYTEGRDPKDRKEFHVQKGASHPWHPLVVLVDQYSASGSEIVVGAIKDHKRGIILGDDNSTFGKGSVQTIFPLRDGKTGLKLTVAYYHTPSGENINRKGIEPDIKYPGLRLTPSEAKMYRKLRGSDSLGEFVKEAGDDILKRLNTKEEKDEKNPDRALFEDFVTKLSQENVFLSENLIKQAIAEKTTNEADDYEYDPVIQFAINHLRALDVLDVAQNR